MSDSVGSDVATIVEERAAVLGFARRFNAGVAMNVQADRLSAEAAIDIQQAIRTFAGDVAIGLHRDGRDPEGVRQAMKPIVEAARDG